MEAGHRHFWLNGVYVLLRTDDPSSSDFDETDLTDDTTWNYVDLDNYIIVPDKAIAVKVKIKAKDNAVSSKVYVASGNNSNSTHRTTCITQVSGIPIELVSHWVELDSQNRIRVLCNPKLSTWQAIDFVVLEWLIDKGG